MVRGDLWGAAAHARSLEELLDADRPGSLSGVLSHVLAPYDVRCEDLGADWLPDDRWVRRLVLHVGPPEGSRGGIAPFVVPWLVDDEACARAGHDVVGGEPGLHVGKHRSPSTSLGVAPGVRLVVQVVSDTLRCELELAPTLGDPVRIAVRRDGERFVMTGRDGRVRASAVEAASVFHGALSTGPGRQSYATEVVERDLRERFGLAGATWGPETLDLLLRRLVEDEARLRAARDDDAEMELGTAAVLVMDRARWTALAYGDQVARAAHRAAVVAVTRRGRLTDPPPLATYVAARLERELDRLARGRGAYSGLVSSAAETNVLGRLEAARQHSFIGPWGLADYQLRMDLRVLPQAWDGLLCPVQTPESTKVGLVRQLAWNPDSDGERPGELSVCASLVPFVNHDDPTRTAIGAKMLRQALLLVDPTPARVTTAAEPGLVEALAVARAPGRARVTAVGPGTVDLAGLDGHARTVAFGAPDEPGRLQPQEWDLQVEVGQEVLAGEVLAVGPEARLDPAGTPRLALGRDALAAFLPWHGWNFEDGVVVSASFAERMTSRHLVHERHAFSGDAQALPFVVETLTAREAGGPLSEGTVVAVVMDGEQTASVAVGTAGRLRPSRSPAYHYLDVDEDGITVTVEVRRPLEVGDKVTTRHSGKGVVTLVLPDAEMPRLPDGRPLEILLNPLGVLRRLNVGAVLEVNAGLLGELEGEEVAAVVRALGAAGRAELAARLAQRGAPGGRVRLTLADGSPCGPEEGVVAGPLHVLKLHHLARAKLTARNDGPPSPTTFQATRGARGAGAAQRMGEMEVWALQALGLDAVVADLLGRRGTSGRDAARAGRRLNPGLRAVLANLAVAGIHLEGAAADGDWRDLSTTAAVDPDTISSVRLRYLGGEEVPAGLTDVMTLEPRARAVLPPRAGVEVVAAEMLRLARAADEDRAESGDRQQTRYAIPLPVEVRHPWRVAGKKGRGRRLPPLHSVALLPAHMLGWSDVADVARTHPLAVTHRLLSQVIHLRDGHARGSAQRLTLEVRMLLGRTAGRDSEEGSVLDRLQGKYGLMTRNLLGTAAYRSGRAVLVGDPTLHPEEIGLAPDLLRGLGIDPDDAAGMDGAGVAGVVLLNRQPTLQPSAIVALRARLVPHRAIVVHPHVLAALAGDFDGDTAAVHRPIDEAAARELWSTCRPSAALRSDANGSLVAKLDLDVALGGLLAGDGAPLVAAVEERLVAAGHARGPSALKVLRDQMSRSFDHVGGWGFSVVDLPAATPPDPGQTPEDHVLDTLALATDATTRIQEAFRAGAGGKVADLTQLLVRRGSGGLPNELLSSPDVPGCFADGLADADYFAAAQVSVGLLAAKKLVTPLAGSLTRRLVTAAYEVTVVRADCGAGHPDGGRGPFSCLDPHPCQRCYGPLLRTGEPPPLGSAVGLLAAMVVGERSTQLAMKSIHQRGRSGGLSGTVAQLESLLVGDPVAPYVGEVAGATPEELLRPGLELVCGLLPDVAPVHLAVLLRCRFEQLQAAAAEDEAHAASRFPFGLESAAVTGSVSAVVRSTMFATERTVDSRLLGLLLGKSPSAGSDARG